MTDSPQNPENPAPPEPPPSQPTPSGGGSNNTLMLVLAYLWLLALVPLLVEKDDAELQWHAKNGLCILVAEVIVWIALTIIGFIPILNLAGCVLGPAAFLAALVIRIMAIVKATKGERFILKGVSDYVERL